MYILVDKSMVYSYNNLAAQISTSKSQDNDFGRAVSMLIDKELLVSCNHVTEYFFQQNGNSVH